MNKMLLEVILTIRKLQVKLKVSLLNLKVSQLQKPQIFKLVKVCLSIKNLKHLRNLLQDQNQHP